MVMPAAVLVWYPILISKELLYTRLEDSSQNYEYAEATPLNFEDLEEQCFEFLISTLMSV